MLRQITGNLSFALQYLRNDTTLRFLSHFNPQTGLAKRSLFCERLARLIAGCAERQPCLIVTVFDVERLNLINDSFSRRTGDLLLQRVAERIRRKFPNTDDLAHFGGGTFALVRRLNSHTTAEHLEAAQSHISALGEPFVIEAQEIPVTVRSGFAMYPQDATDSGMLVQHAEAALHNARTSGERLSHFNAERHVELLGRLTLERKLRRALELGQFELHYQPKVDIKSLRIEGVEALLRWRDPDVGIVSPAEFLPLLESSGLIEDVGTWVVSQASRDCREWLRAGLPPIRVAVNVSPLQLHQRDFVQAFLDAQGAQFAHTCGIDIEVTEGALCNDSVVETQNLATLRRHGIRIAIDDFGIGYSSLQRLASLPVDTLKIDQCFVARVPHDHMHSTLVRTIIALARGLGMTTVAEGVESVAQFDFLAHSGCDQSQGFLHSRPLPFAAMTALLEEGARRAHPLHKAAVAAG